MPETRGEGLLQATVFLRRAAELERQKRQRRHKAGVFMDKQQALQMIEPNNPAPTKASATTPMPIDR